jgi:hypothetical protein
MKKPLAILTGVALVLATVSFLNAQTTASAPRFGTFYLQSSIQNGRVPPPYPFDPYGGLEPIVIVDAANHIYLVRDNSNDWATLQDVRSAVRMSGMGSLDLPGFGGGDGDLPDFPSWTSPTNGLVWLEITNVNTSSQLAYLLLHNTTNTEYYQLLSKTDLLQQEWSLGTYQLGLVNTNQTPFNSVNISTNRTMFFWAHQADWAVYLYAYPEVDAVEPQGNDPGQKGIISLAGYYAGNATNAAATVTVYYRISGTASNGVDYVTLSGVATLTNSGLYSIGYGYTEIDVLPLADNLVDGAETVTLTTIQTNAYVIYTSAASATIKILDSSTIVSIFPNVSKAIRPDGPPGAPAVNGSFNVSRSDLRNTYNDLTVNYQISGTASNGVDYALLSGALELAPGITQTNIIIVPLADSIPAGIETVTLTLIPTNTYVVSSNNNTATISIYDSSTTVNIRAGNNAVEPGQNGNPPGQTGSFVVQRSDTRAIRTNDLTLFYSVSGTTSNGTDYVTLSGTMDFAPGIVQTNINVVPLADNLFEGNESVMLTLIPNPSDANAYLINSNAASATITIADNLPTNLFLTVANVSAPVGMDYHAPLNSIIVSSEAAGGFLRIYTNPIMSNSISSSSWSGISGLADEVKLATVKTTAHGFTNGDMYFGNNAVSKIGWLSADGTVSNLNWATLTNDTYIRGGLYVDQSGSFNGDLIAVTGNGPNQGGGVWRINSAGITTRLANLTNTHLEGVITLTNDPAQWGPWAGKIITGAESKEPPQIYAIDTNGTVTSFSLGIGPEDFDLVPTNQDLYCADATHQQILKVSRTFLASHVGNLLITQSGDSYPARTPTLFIVHWDSATGAFEIFSIPHSSGSFEHMTFAPVNLPAQ